MIEVATILTIEEIPLMTVFGEPAHVDFPGEYIWELHKRKPGLVAILAHTHPNGFTSMSEEDRTTLKAWTIALSPYPVFMDVICWESKEQKSHTRYWFDIESLEEWKSKHKSKQRWFQLRTKEVKRRRGDWDYDMLYLSVKVK